MTSEFFPVDVDESPITSLRRREERNTNNLRARLYHVSIKTILYILNLYEVDVYNDVKYKLDIPRSLIPHIQYLDTTAATLNKYFHLNFIIKKNE